MKVGYTVDEARKLAFYSQIPDEMGAFDAHNLGVVALKSAVTDPGYKRQATIEKGSRYTEGLHLLSDGDALKQRASAMNMVVNNNDSKVAGVAIHPLGDSRGHLRQGEGETRTYPKIIGHAADSLLGEDPDYLHRRKSLYVSHVKDLAESLAKRRGVTTVVESSDEIGTEMLDLVENSIVRTKRHGRNMPRIDDDATNDKTIKNFRDYALRLIDDRVNQNNSHGNGVDPETLIEKPEESSPIGVDNNISDLRRFMETRKGFSPSDEQVKNEADDALRAASDVADKIREELEP